MFFVFLLKFFVFFWDCFSDFWEFFGFFLECFGFFWNVLEFFGIFWNRIKQCLKFDDFSGISFQFFSEFQQSLDAQLEYFYEYEMILSGDDEAS